MALPDPNGTLGRGAYFLGETTLSEGAESATITLPLKSDWYILKAMPNWNTVVYEFSHGAQTCEVIFNVSAPAGALLRWIVFT